TISTFAEMPIDIRDEHGRWQQTKFIVRTIYPQNVTNHDGDKDNKPGTTSDRLVKIYFIEPPKGTRPFDLSAESKEDDDYDYDYDDDYDYDYDTRSSLSKKLEQEWNEIYFCKAAAEFINFINNDADTSIFSPREESGVDLVHVHGAKNALLIEFLKDINKIYNSFRKPPPAVIYTLHDYSKERAYSIRLESVLKFMDSKNYKVEKSNYFRGNRMYTSALAIDQA